MFSAKMRKAIAVFFLLLFVQSVVAPTLSYALTAGPTAPEATSFEPVDTTDMVDLKTGDFTYNIPLLEVPGPAGSYPLNLSYHAGIQPNQEASWVGLGWTVNPGSISRLVNGYPDDHYSVTNIDRTFWEGGDTESYTVGVSVGIGNVATVSAGLTFAQDTYKGYGTGGYVGGGLGYQITDNIGIGVNAQIGVSPYGDPYASAGIGLGVGTSEKQALNLNASVGLSVNSSSGIDAGAGGGVSWSAGRNSRGQSFGGSLLDADISTGGSNGTISVGGGAAGVYNSKSGKVSTNSQNFQVDIPVYYGVNLRLGRNYVRYWIDESEAVYTFGSLYANATPDFSTAFDTYDLLDTDIDITQYDDPEKVLGGGFPDYDFFTVTGQGMSGNIRPHHFQQHLYRQEKRDAADNNKVLSKSYPLESDPDSKPVEFRFINDFSNRFEYTPENFNVTSTDITFGFDNPVVTGRNGAEGYSNNHLVGSKHVEWYTNLEILNAASGTGPYAEGFVNCSAEGFTRDANQQIGGFSITNSSGVTYHYALPAYSFNEYMKSTNSPTKQIENGLAFNALSKPEKYAYTWYLTAVTGPDFVDRNSNGLADQGDWGYWVNFQYEKWLDDYQWRNPGEGVNRDIDGDFEFFSYGNKEIYYLDKIFTESHVAVFEKSARLDGREVSSLMAGGFEPQSHIETPGKQQCILNCENQYCDQGNCNEPGFSNCQQGCNSLPDDVIGYTFPRPTLRLDKIKLFTYQSFTQGGSDENILREIDFGYDYSLADGATDKPEEGTPNSYSNENFTVKLGKLTLQSVEFKGKKGISLIPPTKFDYKNVPYEPSGKDKVDVWGFYKSDYDQTYRDQTNDIIGKLTTPASAESVDAWSLTTIHSPLGASVAIDYESDQYDDVVLAQQQILRTKDITDLGNNRMQVTFWEEAVNLQDVFTVDNIVGIDVVGSYDPGSGIRTCEVCEDFPPHPFHFTRLFSGKVTIKEINETSNYVIVEDEAFYNELKNTTKVFYEGNYPPFECSDTEWLNVACSNRYEGANAWPDYIPAGIISFSEGMRFGGGVRVKSISLLNPNGDDRTTEYEYSNGVTSYEPYEILSPKIHPDYPVDDEELSGEIRNYKKAIISKFYKQLSISRMLPGPGVMYKNVTIREKNTAGYELESYSVYEFEAFDKGMVDVIPDPVNRVPTAGTYDNVQFSGAVLNRKVLKDFTSRVGSLKSITLYRNSDNTPISKTINNYLHDGLDGSFSENAGEYAENLKNGFFNQGLIEQTYTRSRIMLYKAGQGGFGYGGPGLPSADFYSDRAILLATISKYETFPTIPTGQTNINYNTDTESETENISFDFYSGEPTSVLNVDSYGNRYLNVSTPAYEIYPEMGSKVYNKQNKNMLTQTAAHESYLLNELDVKKGLLSASVQTWKKNIPVLNEGAQPGSVWRKHASYQWNGQLDLNDDGTYPIPDFIDHPFNWTDPSLSNSWESTGELTLYDIYSHALEAKDINGDFASSRMSTNQKKVIANAVNASYGEMAYSGSEYYSGNTEDDGGVDRGQGIPSTAYSHTGHSSLLVGTGSKGFNRTLNSPDADLTRKYRASVWVHAPGYSETQGELDKIELYYSANGVETKVHPVKQKSKSKSWYLMEVDINPAGASEVYIGVRNNSQRGVYFDDFRVHPLDASMTSYVYDDFSGELTYILDSKNLYTKFEYDAMGRLVRTSKELLNFDFGNGKESFRADAVLKEVKYNYGIGN